MLFALLLQACELTVPVGAECLAMTEVVTSPTDYVFDVASCEFREVLGDTGFRPDWVEICNPSDVPLDAGTYRLFNSALDNPYHDAAWPLPGVSVASGECFVVIAEPDLVGLCPEIADFDLDQEIGAHLTLKAAGSEFCREVVQFERLRLGWSYALGTDGQWRRDRDPEPGVLQ